MLFSLFSIVLSGGDRFKISLYDDFGVDVPAFLIFGVVISLLCVTGRSGGFEERLLKRLTGAGSSFIGVDLSVCSVLLDSLLFFIGVLNLCVFLNFSS